eukprot:CAMPEP_0179454812 /NCGR_PEP_ID=MMETSP0799-20121207/38764_1 /TAXON_ID=46947 /ORGANISM="Geminigera cryophila, Strain CCMP2564" /LENGTH=173 /DNA_ID=CAMNT_0021253241 /DNA_START=263 /DNA_END=785 /DNA_ORIENTATION=-
MQQRRATWLAQTPNSNGDATSSPNAESRAQEKTVGTGQYLWFFGVLPAASAMFPALVSAAQAASTQDERRTLIIAFLIMKRVYLYSWAVSIVDVAARRARDVPRELGERVQQLNTELFSGVLSERQMKELDSKEAVEAYSQLNKLEGTTQAAALPVFLGVSLLASFAISSSRE